MLSLLHTKSLFPAKLYPSDSMSLYKPLEGVRALSGFKLIYSTTHVIILCSDVTRYIHSISLVLDQVLSQWNSIMQIQLCHQLFYISKHKSLLWHKRLMNKLNCVLFNSRETGFHQSEYTKSAHHFQETSGYHPGHNRPHDLPYMAIYILL